MPVTEIRGSQIRAESITGAQIEDGSIQASDIKDGSITLADLSQEVKDSVISGGSSWKTPVANSAALPSTGNSAADVRITLDTFKIWIWNGTAWIDPTASFLSLNT